MGTNTKQIKLIEDELDKEIPFQEINELEITSTKSIEFDIKTKIFELDKIIKEAHTKQRNLHHRRKIKSAIELLTPFLKSSNKKASERITEVIDILEQIS